MDGDNNSNKLNEIRSEMCGDRMRFYNETK